MNARVAESARTSPAARRRRGTRRAEHDLGDVLGAELDADRRAAPAARRRRRRRRPCSRIWRAISAEDRLELRRRRSRLVGGASRWLHRARPAHAAHGCSAPSHGARSRRSSRRAARGAPRPRASRGTCARSRVAPLGAISLRAEREHVRVVVLARVARLARRRSSSRRARPAPCWRPSPSRCRRRRCTIAERRHGAARDRLARRRARSRGSRRRSRRACRGRRPRGRASRSQPSTSPLSAKPP